MLQLSRTAIILVDCPDCRQDVAALFGEILGNLHEVTAAMSHAAGDHVLIGLEVREVGCQGVAHANHRGQVGLSLLEQLAHILASVVAAREQKGDLEVVVDRDDPSGMEARAGIALRALKVQDLRPGVV